MVSDLREDIENLEELIQEQKNNLPDLPFQTINVKDNKGEDVSVGNPANPGAR